MKRDTGLDVLLDMSGEAFILEGGYWCNIEAWSVEPTKERPHGIRYNLTLHDKHNTRIYGMDNAHIPKNTRKGYHGRIIEFDHIHKDEHDKGSPYAFKDAGQLIVDFWDGVEGALLRQRGE